MHCPKILSDVKLYKTWKTIVGYRVGAEIHKSTSRPRSQCLCASIGQWQVESPWKLYDLATRMASRPDVHVAYVTAVVRVAVKRRTFIEDEQQGVQGAVEVAFSCGGN